MQLTGLDRAALVQDIAGRVAPAGILAKRYGATVAELKGFVADNLTEIQQAQEALDNPETPLIDVVTPAQLADLWIANKFDRLVRLQRVADIAHDAIVFSNKDMSSSEQATMIREFRSYMLQAANELGQLLHRGAGDTGETDRLSVDMQGVDMDSLR